MAKVSKGRLKHLWKLYGVWEVISSRNMIIWFFKADPIYKKTVEDWLVQNQQPEGLVFRPAEQEEIRRMQRAGIEPMQHGCYTFAQEMATKGYYEGCRRISNEVDTEFTYSVTKQRQFNIEIDRTKERTPGYVEVVCGSFSGVTFPPVPVMPPGA